MFSHFYYVKHQYSSFWILYFIVQLKKCFTITCNTKIIENHWKYNYLVILYNYYLEENYLYILGGILKKNRNFGGLLWVKAEFSRENRFSLPTYFPLLSLLSSLSLLSPLSPLFLDSFLLLSRDLLLSPFANGSMGWESGKEGDEEDEETFWHASVYLRCWTRDSNFVPMWGTNRRRGFY